MKQEDEGLRAVLMRLLDDLNGNFEMTQNVGKIV
jgi:hypothetical protein